MAHNQVLNLTPRQLANIFKPQRLPAHETRGGFLADVSSTVEDRTGRPATALDAVARSALQV